MRLNKGMMKATKNFKQSFPTDGWPILKNRSRGIRRTCKEAYMPRETAQIYVRRAYADELESGKFTSLDERIKIGLGKIMKDENTPSRESAGGDSLTCILTSLGGLIGMGAISLANSAFGYPLNNPRMDAGIALVSGFVGGWIGKKISDRITYGVDNHSAPLEGLPSYDRIKRAAWVSSNGDRGYAERDADLY